METMKDIKRIVLTGGPCAGKTSALVRVIEHFSSLGYKVFTIPEVPTMFTQAGMDYLTQNKDFFYEGEKATLEIQMAFEDKFLKMAKACTEPAVIICDRGTMDISAYMKPEMWEEITRAAGTSTHELRDTRYDAILHLVSAADGAEQYYTTNNNASRNEPADEQGLQIARMLDKKVIEAWAGHPHHRVINNQEDFDRKLNRVIKEIANVLELPQPIEEERKYIVEITGTLPDSIDSDITQTYLTGEPGSEIRLRRRVFGSKIVNVHTTKKRDPYRQTIRKHRKSFIWKGQYFELDTYQEPFQNLVILETKGIASHADVRFPPFIRVIEDITGNQKYYNYNLALKK